MDIKLVETPCDIPASIESIPEAYKRPIKTYNSAIERDKSIIACYKEGMAIAEIAVKHNLSEPRIFQIVRFKSSVKDLDKDHEKARRFRRLRQAEDKAPKNLAPKDTDQLVKIIEAQRKELEGDNQSASVTNIQINGDIKVMNINDKWSTLRNMLEQ